MVHDDYVALTASASRRYGCTAFAVAFMIPACYYGEGIFKFSLLDFLGQSEPSTPGTLMLLLLGKVNILSVDIEGTNTQHSSSLIYKWIEGEGYGRYALMKRVLASWNTLKELYTTFEHNFSLPYLHQMSPQ